MTNIPVVVTPWGKCVFAALEACIPSYANWWSNNLWMVVSTQVLTHDPVTGLITNLDLDTYIGTTGLVVPQCAAGTSTQVYSATITTAELQAGYALTAIRSGALKSMDEQGHPTAIVLFDVSTSSTNPLTITVSLTK